MVLNHIINKVKAGEKQFVVLIDPDDFTPEKRIEYAPILKSDDLSFVLVGGSLLVKDKVEDTVSELRKLTDKKIVIFPANASHISLNADAILFLSLISGRNPEFLIGNHVIAAPIIKRNNLEAISTGYMLIDCGTQTTASYISNTTPIPYNKNSIAVATAMAGELLGNDIIYMDGGSGAKKRISNSMIRAVKENISIPLIVGGGIKTEQEIEEIFENGADIVVVGTAIESAKNASSKFNKLIKAI